MKRVRCHHQKSRIWIASHMFPTPGLSASQLESKTMNIFELNSFVKRFDVAQYFAFLLECDITIYLIRRFDTDCHKTPESIQKSISNRWPIEYLQKVYLGKSAWGTVHLSLRVTPLSNAGSCLTTSTSTIHAHSFPSGTIHPHNFPAAEGLQVIHHSAGKWFWLNDVIEQLTPIVLLYNVKSTKLNRWDASNHRSISLRFLDQFALFLHSFTGLVDWNATMEFQKKSKQNIILLAMLLQKKFFLCIRFLPLLHFDEYSA